MEIEYIRDYAMYAAIFGMFGFAWFGWAQENPPKKLRLLLGLGAATSFVVATVGGFLATKNWNAGSALNNDGAYELFGAIVAVEIITALLGSLFLLKRRKSQWVTSWVAFVVGAHFLPLAILFDDPWLHVLTLLVILATLLPTLYSFKKMKANTATCLLTGAALLAFAIRGLVLFFMIA